MSFDVPRSQFPARLCGARHGAKMIKLCRTDESQVQRWRGETPCTGCKFRPSRLTLSSELSGSHVQTHNVAGVSVMSPAMQWRIAAPFITGLRSTPVIRTWLPVNTWPPCSKRRPLAQPRHHPLHVGVRVRPVRLCRLAPPARAACTVRRWRPCRSPAPGSDRVKTDRRDAMLLGSIGEHAMLRKNAAVPDRASVSDMFRSLRHVCGEARMPLSFRIIQALLFRTAVFRGSQ
jgi:hypothetical protein